MADATSRARAAVEPGCDPVSGSTVYVASGAVIQSLRTTDTALLRPRAVWVSGGNEFLPELGTCAALCVSGPRC